MSRFLLPKSPTDGGSNARSSVQVPTLPMFDTLSSGRNELQERAFDRPLLQRIETDVFCYSEDRKHHYGHRHTRSLEGPTAPPVVDMIHSASSDSIVFSQNSSDNVNHALPGTSLPGPYISHSSRRSFSALPTSPALQHPSAIPSSSALSSPVDDLSGDNTAVEDDSETEDVWDLRPYDISWGNSYYGYKRGTLPGPDGACIFLRSPIPLKYQRTGQACEKCRERKAKCTGTRPSCSRCAGRGLECVYAPETKRTRVYDSADEEKTGEWTTSESGQTCHKPRPCRRMTLPIPESMYGHDQSPDPVFNYSGHPTTSIHSTLRRSHSTAELSVPASSTSSYPMHDGYHTAAFGRSSFGDAVYRDAPHVTSRSSKISDESAYQMYLLERSDRSLYGHCAALKVFDDELLSYKPSITYDEQTGNWAHPVHFQANDESSLHPLLQESGDLDDTGQHDSMQPSGLPMAAPLESVTMLTEDFYQNFDPYLEPASMDLEMCWSDFAPNDRSFEYEQTLNLFAFEQQGTIVPDIRVHSSDESFLQAQYALAY